MKHLYVDLQYDNLGQAAALSDLLDPMAVGVALPTQLVIPEGVAAVKAFAAKGFSVGVDLRLLDRGVNVMKVSEALSLAGATWWTVSGLAGPYSLMAPKTNDDDPLGPPWVVASTLSENLSAMTLADMGLFRSNDRHDIIRTMRDTAVECGVDGIMTTLADAHAAQCSELFQVVNGVTSVEDAKEASRAGAAIFCVAQPVLCSPTPMAVCNELLEAYHELAEDG